MPWEVHAGLTARGFVPLTTVFTPTFERAAITALGVAEALDPAPPIRYIHLGWWAFYEDLPDTSWGGPAGLYVSQYHWLSFIRENWADGTSGPAFGYSGFVYSLYPGVELTLGFFSP